MIRIRNVRIICLIWKKKGPMRRQVLFIFSSHIINMNQILFLFIFYHFVLNHIRLDAVFSLFSWPHSCLTHYSPYFSFCIKDGRIFAARRLHIVIGITSWMNSSTSSIPNGSIPFQSPLQLNSGGVIAQKELVIFCKDRGAWWCKWVVDYTEHVHTCMHARMHTYTQVFYWNHVIHNILGGVLFQAENQENVCRYGKHVERT